MSHDVPFFSRRTGLLPLEAIRRIRELGPSSAIRVLHSSSTSVDLLIDKDPFAPVLRVLVEDRSDGSYVTARVIPSTFLEDFMRVTKSGFTFLVFAAIAAMSLNPASNGLPEVISALVVCWAVVLAALTIGQDVLAGRTELGTRRGRLRMRLVHALL